jgi:hypothetical protein
MIVMQEAHPWVRFCETYRESRVGMDVARFQVALGSWVQTSFTFLGQYQEGDFDMLWTILVILLVLWLIGLLSNVGGSLIHLLLVVAVVVLIINLVTGRRAV